MSAANLITAAGGIDAAAAITGCCPRAVYQWSATGRIPRARSAVLLLQAAGRSTGLAAGICGVDTPGRTGRERVAELVEALGGVAAAARAGGVTRATVYLALRLGHVQSTRLAVRLLEAAGRSSGLLGTVV